MSDVYTKLLTIEGELAQVKSIVNSILGILVARQEMVTLLKQGGVSVKNITFIKNDDDTIDFIGKQGTTWDFSLILGTDTDLSAYTFVGQIRTNYGGQKVADITFVSYDPIAKHLLMRVPATATANIPPYKQSIDKTKLKTYTGAGVYVYDIEMTSPANYVTRIMEGKCFVDPEVTK